MKVLKLGCANCGAPLEISADLEVFACGYCGTQQRVERSGGTVALRKVETAIKAVQRGTDRTAAELALPRLRRELANLQDEMLAAVKAAVEKRENSLSMRRNNAFIGFFFTLVFGSSIVGVAGLSIILTGLLAVVWVISLIAIPLYLYQNAKIESDDSLQVRYEYKKKLEIIQLHIEANRKILDQLPI